MTSPEPERAHPRTSTSGRRPRADAQDVRQEFWRDFDSGWVMVAELLAAIFTWGGVGWLLDRWLGTPPWLMSFGFLLGFGTGFYLLYARTTGKIAPPRSRTGQGSQRDD